MTHTSVPSASELACRTSRFTLEGSGGYHEIQVHGGSRCNVSLLKSLREVFPPHRHPVPARSQAFEEIGAVCPQGNPESFLPHPVEDLSPGNRSSLPIANPSSHLPACLQYDLTFRKQDGQQDNKEDQPLPSSLGSGAPRKAPALTPANPPYRRKGDSRRPGSHPEAGPPIRH